MNEEARAHVRAIDEGIYALRNMMENTKNREEALEILEAVNASDYMTQKQIDKIWEATADAKWENGE